MVDISGLIYRVCFVLLYHCMSDDSIYNKWCQTRERSDWFQKTHLLRFTPKSSEDSFQNVWWNSFARKVGNMSISRYFNCHSAIPRINGNLKDSYKAGVIERLSALCCVTVGRGFEARPRPWLHQCLCIHLTATSMWVQKAWLPCHIHAYTNLLVNVVKEDIFALH